MSYEPRSTLPSVAGARSLSCEKKQRIACVFFDGKEKIGRSVTPDLKPVPTGFLPTVFLSGLLSVLFSSTSLVYRRVAWVKDVSHGTVQSRLPVQTNETVLASVLLKFPVRVCTRCQMFHLGESVTYIFNITYSL